MRILMVTEEVPAYPGRGGATRMYYLLQELSQRHDLALLLVGGNESVREMAAAVLTLQGFCRRVEILSAPPILVQQSAVVSPPTANPKWTVFDYLRGAGRMITDPPDMLRERRALTSLVQARVREIGQRWPFDILQVEHSWAGAWLADFTTPAAKVLTYHNLHWLLTESELRATQRIRAKLWLWFERRKLLQYERDLTHRYDLCVTMSEADRARLQAAAPTARVAVVPNGVDTRYFQPADSPAEHASVVFTGTLAYPPNTDGVRYFHREILPLVRAQRPDVSFLAVGLDPPPDLTRLNAEVGVQVIANVPDIRPYIEQATVFVVPLRMGSGTRLKILDALATGKAVVSTSLGCEGIGITPGVNILVADTAPEFAQAVLRLLEDAELRSRLGRAGRHLVEQSYSWESIARLQEMAYAQLNRAWPELPRATAPGPDGAEPAASTNGRDNIRGDGADAEEYRKDDVKL